MTPKERGIVVAQLFDLEEIVVKLPWDFNPASEADQQLLVNAIHNWQLSYNQKILKGLK